MDFLNFIIFENSIKNWLIALGILVGVFLILTLIKWIISNRLLSRVKTSKTELDNFIIPVLNQTRWFSFLALGLYFGILALNIPTETRRWLLLGNQVILSLQLGFWGTGLISYYVNRSVANKVKEDHGEDATTLDALGLMGKILLWVILSLIILDNLNIEIISLVASLCIGGIAVDMARQNIMCDLFASI